MGAGLDRSAPPPARQRVRHRLRPAPGGAPRATTAPPRLDFQTGVPEDARTMVVVPTLLTSVAGVVELLEHVEVLALGNVDPRPLRHPRRFRRRCHRRTAGGRRDPGRRPRRGGRPERPPRPGSHRPVSPVPSGTPVESRRGFVDRVGAQTRQARGVQPSTAGCDRHELPSPRGRPADAAQYPLLHHAGQRHRLRCTRPGSSSASSPIR